MKKPKSPKTDSIQKLAEFWDTDDTTDFEDQLEEVKEPVFVRAPRHGQIVRVRSPRLVHPAQSEALRKEVRDLPLDAAYEQMAKDKVREVEAREWAEGTVRDAADQTR